MIMDKALGTDQLLRGAPCILFFIRSIVEVNECISGLYDLNWITFTGLADA